MAEKPAPKPPVFRPNRFTFESYEIVPSDGDKAYDPGQPRDDSGQWSDGGGGGSSGGGEKPPGKPKKPQKPKEPKAPDKTPEQEERDARSYRDFGTWDEGVVASGFQREAPKPTDKQHEAIEFYRDISGNAQLNRNLRTGQPLTGEAAQHAKELDSILGQSKLEHDTLVYRGIATDNPQARIFADQIKSGQLKVGSTLVDKGYASTTLDGSTAGQKFGDGGVVFKIKAPKGSEALYINAASDKYVGGHYNGEFRDEKEVLLPRDANFRVTSIKKGKNGYEVEMTYDGVGASAGKSAAFNFVALESFYHQFGASKDDCVGRHMKEIQQAHPEWSHDQQIAVALSKCGESNKTMNYDALRAAYEALTGQPVKPLKSAGSDIATPDNLELNDAEKAIWERTYKRVLGITSDEMKATLAAYGAITRSRYSLSVKSVKSDGVTTIKGWGILYGDTGHKDLDQTYFSNKTKYLLKYYANAPLFIEHGQEDYIGSYPIGMRSLTEEYPDYGIWVEHELDPQEEVFQVAPGLHDQIVSDVDAGLYSYSSDSMSHHVSGGYNPKSGELTIWPLAALSLVKRPAEPGLGPVTR